MAKSISIESLGVLSTWTSGLCGGRKLRLKLRMEMRQQ
jgi:hypothetical protein